MTGIVNVLEHFPLINNAKELVASFLIIKTLFFQHC